MKFRIDGQAFKTDPLHAGRLAICIVVFGALVYFVDAIRAEFMPPFPFQLSYSVLPPPHFYLAGLKVTEGIDRFGGDIGDPSWKWSYLKILVVLLFSFIVAPTLLVWGLRARAEWRQKRETRGSPIFIAAALTVGGYYFLLLSFVALVAMPTQLWVMETQRKESRLAAQRDAIAVDLQLMAFKARTFYHLPVPDGGGGGRWMNIPGRRSSTLTLEDIAHPEPVLARIYAPLFPQQPAHFVLEVFAGDSLAIWGVGHEEVADKSFPNKDSRRGKIQVCLGVGPTTISYTDNQ